MERCAEDFRPDNFEYDGVLWCGGLEWAFTVSSHYWSLQEVSGFDRTTFLFVPYCSRYDSLI